MKINESNYNTGNYRKLNLEDEVGFLKKLLNSDLLLSEFPVIREVTFKVGYNGDLEIYTMLNDEREYNRLDLRRPIHSRIHDLIKYSGFQTNFKSIRIYP